MTDILEQARTVEKFRRMLNASRASPGDLQYDLTLMAFMTERERLVVQPINNALDGLIVADAARQAAVALIGGAEKLKPDGVRVLAWDLVSALDGLKKYFETESGTTLGKLNLDSQKTLH